MYTRRGGFTLIELLVVIAIIMLLAGITTMAMMGMSRRKREMLALHRIKEIEQAIQRFRFDHNQYPWDLPVGGDPVNIVWIDLCKELNPTNPDLDGVATYNTSLKDYMDFGSEGKEIIAGKVVDPWSDPTNPQTYEIFWDRDRDKVIIWSLGEDGVDDTLDDADPSLAGDGSFGDDVHNL